MKSVSSKLLRARPLLGTFVEITAAGVDVLQLEQAIKAAFAAVERVHQLMSFHERWSDVSRINFANGGQTIVIHDWTCGVLHTALDLQRRSKGAFNIAVGPALERLG